MNDKITIDGEKYSASDIELLTGGEGMESPRGYILLMARALEDPLRLPKMLKEICGLDLSEEERCDMRMALIRVQVDADLRMHQDIQRYQQRRYVAQVVEILMFREMMLAPRVEEEEEME